VIAGSITDIAERTALFRAPFATSLSRAVGLPRSAWGTAFAHAGIGLTLLGIVCETTWSSEQIAAIKEGDVVTISGYTLRLDGVVKRQGPNYREMLAHFTVKSGDEIIGTMSPSKRDFTTRDSQTTETALMTRGLSQLYVSLGDNDANGGIAVRIYHKPLVLLIWLGALVMAMGGMLSLSDRRLRVGAPKPASKKSAARLHPQPAE
jgi:cytochrome c-type biogenesis protein CcmF